MSNSRPPALDKRAVRILCNAYWSPSGWKKSFEVSADDFDHAKACGVMFDTVPLSHDEAIRAAREAVRATSQSKVVHSFIYSLGSRRLDLRSALGSYAVGRHMMSHQKSEVYGSGRCSYCGLYDRSDIDLNASNFERIKWGGVRHSDPSYIAFDLQIFSKTQEIEPCRCDLAILERILGVVRSMPPSARLGHLVRALGKVLPSNTAERRTLVDILGYAGVITDPGRPDFQRRFVPEAEREHTPWQKDDWSYPARWWTGTCGLNQSAADEWFGGL